jgi:hypothetical protein
MCNQFRVDAKAIASCQSTGLAVAPAYVETALFIVRITLDDEGAA